MGAEDADAVQPGRSGRGDTCLGVLEGDDLARLAAEKRDRTEVARRIRLPVLDVVRGDDERDGIAESCPGEHRLDLSPERARDDGDRHAIGCVRDGVPDTLRDRLSPSCQREVAVDPLLDERGELWALGAEPGSDDRLLGEACKGSVVVVLGEGPPALGEHVAVHGVEDGLVARERPVEVEGDSADDAHPRASVPLPAAELRHAPAVLLAIDQGTTGTTCLVVDDELQAVGRGYREIEQHFPEPGWVEHDAEEIWESVLAAASEALAQAQVTAHDLAAVGITNQRETTVVWDRASGRPLQRAIVWQDRRTADRCRALPRELIRTRTGLVPDPYFSATKLEWILERTDRPQGDLAFGTVDSWLVWKLTQGAAHVIDVTNASRTLLVDLDRLDWDDELLALFGVDRVLLPEIVPSSGVVAEASLLGATVPISGIAGDQQAALFGQGCFLAGEAKATYGTGSFVLVNVGSDVDPPPEGLLRTAAAVAPGEPPQFALEGAVLVAGAAVQWLRDGLGLISSASEAEALATEVESSEGVIFVPALTGLGSPHWDPDARGLVTGLTRGTTRAHLVRATLEAIAFQVADVLDAYPDDVLVLRADGGAAANGFLMQFQSDLLGCPVEVAAEAETTALGAAALAGLAVGVWPDTDALQEHIRRGARYEPAMSRDEAALRRDEWQRGLERAFSRGPA